MSAGEWGKVMTAWSIIIVTILGVYFYYRKEDR